MSGVCRFCSRHAQYKLQEKTDTGRFQAEVTNLKPGVKYRYRAIVKHPLTTMRRDH
jgi:hypothetical protein